MSKPKIKKQPKSIHRSTRPDDGNAFLPDPGGGPAHTNDDIAENLAEQFLESATSGEEVGEDALNVQTEEEDGGPFVPSTAEDEFAHEPDASNPLDAEPETFPTPMRSPPDD